MTCGGLCPGINVVIRELVMALRYNYGVSEIYGIRWGFHGFTKKDCWIKLTPEDVKHIHLLGGTVLGTSRYGFEGNKIAETSQVCRPKPLIPRVSAAVMTDGRPSSADQSTH